VKQQRIDGLRLLSGDGPQRGGQRKGDQEVRDRQEQRLLLGQPGWGGVLLAGRAVAIATGVVAVAGDLTRWAGIDGATKGFGPALGDRLPGLQLAFRQRATKARALGGAVATEEVAEGGHRIPAERVSSTPLASSSALWVRWV